VLVSAETSGRILQRNFSEGSTVEVGDTLALIDPTRIQLDIASMTAARQSTVASLETSRLAVTKARETERFAKSEADRIARLLKSGSATQKQMDQLSYEAAQAVVARQSAEANVSVIQAQLEKVNADLNRLNRQLQDCYPLSPISGTVTEAVVEMGEIVSPGKGLAKIANLQNLWVKVYLPSQQFSTVKVGEKAKVSTESGDKSYEGEVIWTSDEAEFTPKNVQTEKSRANLVYAVKVRINNSDGLLKIGMPVFVTLER
jgi:HlyD family secretion protein